MLGLVTGTSSSSTQPMGSAVERAAAELVDAHLRTGGRQAWRG
ncbi:MAG: hypothetical protein WKF73_07465 [Nocardioidaceae bacterium]